jgi:hypothetical protein
MATHESWQFAFVKQRQDGIIQVPKLGHKSPLRTEVSNLVNGSKPVEEQPNTVVDSNHIRVYWSIPSDTLMYQLTGKAKIFRKTKEFVRSMNDTESFLVKNIDFSTTLQGVERDLMILHLDDELESGDTTYYYTIFYEATHTSHSTTHWVYSPIHSHDRAFVLDFGESPQGNALYQYMPVGVRQEDYNKAQSTLYKLLQVFGKSFDEFKARMDKFNREKYKIDMVDAAYIPYIDQLLGWPTNYELSELRRREETGNAISVWKGKGAGDALELVLQNLLEWDVEIIQARDYVVTTATGDEALVGQPAPTGWDNNVDGSWNQYRDSLPFNGTVDLSGRVVLRGGINDNFRVMADMPKKAWKNPFEFIVQLINPISGGKPLLGGLIRDKLDRIMPYLVVHYAGYTLLSDESYSDSGGVKVVEQVPEPYQYRPSSESYEIQVNHTSLATGLNLLYTWSNSAPFNDTKNVLWTSSTGADTHRTYHSAFNY